MKENILFFVSEEGDIVVDFAGFRGNDCVTTGKVLQGLLKEYGVEIDITEQIKKDTEEIEAVNKNVNKH